MTKKALLSVGMILLLLFNNSNIVFAEPNSSDTQAIQENKVKYEQLDDETMELDAEIGKLNIEIENLNNQLAKNNSEIEDTENEIITINHKIEEAKLEIEETQKTINGRVRSMYKSNMATDMIVYLVTSENIFDMLDRVQAMGRIISVDKQMIIEINEKKETLDKNAKEIEKKQSDLKKLKKSIESSLGEVNNKKEEQQKLLDNLNSRKDEIMSIIEANEEKLISHPLSIINSDSASISEVQDAVNTLQYMLPQLNSDYVIGLANDAIALGNEKIALSETPPPTSNSLGDVSNSNSNNLATYSMTATAYTGNGFTATGLKPVRDPNGLSTIAVDPSVIPLGSKVHIEGYGYAIASDTGGAIKGNKIDLYMNSEAECLSFGRRTVTVTIIAYPGQW
ncbi:3D domain-containing protein [Clostridium tertium]|uniref:3D domain-containing protein n=1 Tax=Clostridium tertium TaxID=1559 RepID=UPI001AE326F6|nr:3D domain-containing protein [Clostridium tertium]MBP1867625.1 3D (Asp-Asp-Asp) domain-containing protein/peptidoglycan hydrolase CwlO-like protein [Clostridium tertium]